MKTLFPLLLCSLGLSALTLSAQQLDTIAISEVKATPALLESVQRQGKLTTMRRLVEAMDGQLIDRIASTRKFQVVSRSDLAAIFQEQDLVASGNVDDLDPNAARPFSLAGAKYLLVTGIDDFQDLTETARFEAIGRTATRRTIRFSAVTRIYDSSTGRLLESANFQLSNHDVDESSAFVTADGEIAESLLVAMAREMAEKVSLRVIDVLHPATVVARSGNTVTINRGDGAGMRNGQVWDVFAVGEEMIDPGTGISLGREEVHVGVVRITRVNPLVTQAEVIEDFGIERLHVLRLK